MRDARTISGPTGDIKPKSPSVLALFRAAILEEAQNNAPVSNTEKMINQALFGTRRDLRDKALAWIEQNASYLYKA